MTQTGNTAELMLTPGEVRTHYLGDDETVSVYSVAGGSFTHVRVARGNGRTVWCHGYMFETDALAAFAEIKTNGVPPF
jgi:hypothetical protein